MARHDQRQRENKFVCTLCRDFDCWHCIDVARSVYSTDAICVCKDSDHAAKFAEGLETLKKGALK